MVTKHLRHLLPVGVVDTNDISWREVRLPGSARSVWHTFTADKHAVCRVVPYVKSRRPRGDERERHMSRAHTLVRDNHVGRLSAHRDRLAERQGQLGVVWPIGH
eukprot:scaffold177692_cov24-Tisochrysis_lutea.AAC.1